MIFRHYMGFIFYIPTILLIVSIYFVHHSFIGMVLLLVYLLVNGLAVGILFSHAFKIKESALAAFMGIFIVFISTAVFLGIGIILFSLRYNDFLLSAILLLETALTGFLIKKLPDGKKWFVYSNWREAVTKLIQKNLAERRAKATNRYRLLLPIVVFLLFAIGFAMLLFSGAPNAHIMSPWEVIPRYFVFVIVGLSLFILARIFFAPSRYFLLLIILFSLLQHLYIPAVYQLPYGVDSWRHIGSIQYLEKHGHIELDTYDTARIAGVPVKSGLLTISSYAPFWGAILFLHRTTHVDIVVLNVWWQYLLFSVYVPILMWFIMKRLFSENITAGLLGAFLPSLFYPLQAFGVMTLPVSFGFLAFLLFAFTCITWLKTPSRLTRALIFVQWALIGLNYIIYFLFATLVIGFVWVIRFTKSRTQGAAKLVRLVYLFVSACMIPVISFFVSPEARFVILHTDAKRYKDFFIHTIRYGAGLQNPESPSNYHTGNSLWNTMRKELIDVLPFSFTYFDTLLFVVVICIIGVGIFLVFKRQKETSQRQENFGIIFVYLFFVAAMSAFLDYHYLAGSHLLTERFDLVINFLCIFFIIQALIFLKQKQFPGQRLVLICVIGILSFTIGSTYVSGPVYGRVTGSQYKAMQALYTDMALHERKEYCVVSEFFPLAALEVASSGTIKNGRFPIFYGYKEDVGALFLKMFSKPDIRIMELAMRLSSAPGCYLVIDERFLAPWNKTQIGWILGQEVLKVDDVHVWVYEKKMRD